MNKIEKIKIYNWSNRSKGYFFGKDSQGNTVFLHCTQFINPVEGKIMAGRTPGYNCDTNRIEILSDEYVTKYDSEVYAIIKKTDKGLQASAIAVDKQRFISHIKKWHNVKDFEDCALKQEIKRQLDHDEWSRMMA